MAILTSINELIGKDVTIEVEILESHVKFTLEKMHLAYDSLRKPPHRLVASDRKGNAIFIMLKEG